MAPTWLSQAAVVAMHDLLLAEHGGATGIRDPGLLDSALARPRQLHAYGEPDTCDMAAAYAAGIIRNHPRLEQTPKGACDRGACSRRGRCGLGPEAARRKRRAPVPSGCEVPDRLWGAFVDGNKRSGFMSAYVFLTLNGLQLAAAEVDVVRVVTLLAANEIDETAIAAWLRDNCEPA